MKLFFLMTISLLLLGGQTLAEPSKGKGKANKSGKYHGYNHGGVNNSSHSFESFQSNSDSLGVGRAKGKDFKPFGFGKVQGRSYPYDGPPGQIQNQTGYNPASGKRHPHGGPPGQMKKRYRKGKY